MEDLLDRLIGNHVIFRNLHPDQIHLMGCSAGGDGVYHIAPRMEPR